MTMYLDSASADVARAAFGLGFVSGITTNPKLLASAPEGPAAALRALCDVASPGTVFYQLHARDLAGSLEEARRAVALRPEQIGLKIPCTEHGLAAARVLRREGCLVGITAIFSAAQAALAVQVGAHFILPYVNRATRLLGDGPGLVREMRAVIDGAGAETRILAASIKTPQEAVATLLAGAHDLTLPFELLREMARHQHSEAAVSEFAEHPFSHLRETA